MTLIRCWVFEPKDIFRRLWKSSATEEIKKRRKKSNEKKKWINDNDCEAIKLKITNVFNSNQSFEFLIFLLLFLFFAREPYAEKIVFDKNLESRRK